MAHFDVLCLEIKGSCRACSDSRELGQLWVAWSYTVVAPTRLHTGPVTRGAHPAHRYEGGWSQAALLIVTLCPRGRSRLIFTVVLGRLAVFPRGLLTCFTMVY